MQDLLSDFKAIETEITKHKTTYIVMNEDTPSFQITPIEDAPKKKKYTKEDIRKFVFSDGKPEEQLATTYKDILYGE